jgi:hypothetical protein
LPFSGASDSTGEASISFCFFVSLFFFFFPPLLFSRADSNNKKEKVINESMNQWKKKHLRVGAVGEMWKGGRGATAWLAVGLLKRWFWGLGWLEEEGIS